MISCIGEISSSVGCCFDINYVKVRMVPVKMYRFPMIYNTLKSKDRTNSSYISFMHMYISLTHVFKINPGESFHAELFSWPDTTDGSNRLRQFQ